MFYVILINSFLLIAVYLFYDLQANKERVAYYKEWVESLRDDLYFKDYYETISNTCDFDAKYNPIDLSNVEGETSQESCFNKRLWS